MTAEGEMYHHWPQYLQLYNVPDCLFNFTCTYLGSASEDESFVTSTVLCLQYNKTYVPRKFVCIRYLCMHTYVQDNKSSG